MTLGDRIAAAARAGVEGFAWVRARRSGAVHRIAVRSGRVVGAATAGSFDPLLLALVRAGALDAERYWRVLEAMASSERRSGELATEIGGVAPARVAEVVEAQVRARVAAAIALVAAEVGFDRARLHGPERVCGIDAVEVVRGAARARDRGTRPGAPALAAPPAPLPTAAERRKELRRLARALHPDLHAATDPGLRAMLAARLAEATAAYHGLR